MLFFILLFYFILLNLKNHIFNIGIYNFFYIYVISILILMIIDKIFNCFNYRHYNLKKFILFSFISFIIFLTVFINDRPIYTNLNDKQYFGYMLYPNDKKFDFYTIIDGRLRKIYVSNFNMSKKNYKLFELCPVVIDKINKTEFVVGNFNDFDYENYLKSKLYYGFINVDIIKTIEKSQYEMFKNDFFSSLNLYDRIFFNIKFFSYNIRQKIINIFDELDIKSRNLSKILFLSENSDNLILDISKKIGIIHIFVISGFHYSLIVGSFRKILNIFIKKYRINSIISIFFAFLFFIMNEFQVSSMRAFLILIIDLLGFYFKKDTKNMQTIFILANIILIFNPYSLYQIGFILSFLSNIVLIYIKRFKWIDGINSLFLKDIIVSFIIYIFTLPFIMSIYLKIGIIRIFITTFFTIIVVAFMKFVMLYLFIKIFFIYNFLNIDILKKIINFFADNIYKSINIFKNINDIEIEFNYNFIMYLMLFVVIFFIVDFIFYNKKIEKFILLFSIFFLFIVLNNYNYDLSIRTYSLRDGESYLIKYKDLNIVYDVSNDENIVKLLKMANVKKIDLLVISHKHQDHIGMLEKVLKSFKVEKYIIENTGRKQFKLLDLVITLDNLRGEKIGLNDGSIIMQINYKNHIIQLNGDIENLGIDYYLENFEKSTEFLKLPHHGSYRKNVDKLIQYNSPKFIIISGGRKKRIKKAESINKINEYKIKYYDTNIDGEIRIFYFINKYFVKTSKNKYLLESLKGEY